MTKSRYNSLQQFIVLGKENRFKYLKYFLRQENSSMLAVNDKRLQNIPLGCHNICERDLLRSPPKQLKTSMREPYT